MIVTLSFPFARPRAMFVYQAPAPSFWVGERGESESSDDDMCDDKVRARSSFMCWLYTNASARWYAR
jgi:hypothetical protein